MYQHVHNDCHRGKRSHREKGLEEIMAENVPYLIKHINLHIQEAQRILSKIYTKRSTSKGLCHSHAQLKQRENLENNKEKLNIQKIEAVEAKKWRDDIVNMLKGK